jgi:3-hydroxyisobutyrate dehydrogenase-like beta-hydroxyacid dehydrogenase
MVGLPSDVCSTTLSGLAPAGILVDMTTTDPTLAVEIVGAADCSAVDALESQVRVALESR